MTVTDGAAVADRYVADRVRGLPRSATVALLDRVNQLKAQGVSVLNLSGGEPDFATPAHISEAAESALRTGFTHYTPSRGLPELREAIARKLEFDNGVRVDPSQGVIVTPSAKHALFIALATVLDEGDEVLIPTPSWVSYESMVQLSGGRAVPVRLDPADGFALTPALLEAAVTRRSKVILVNSPNNPTGRVLSAAEAAAVAEVAERHDLLILTDEIYEAIRYGGRPHLSLAALPGYADRTVTVNGFSKGYAMTGWRLGYAAGPAAIMNEMVKVQEHTVGCASSFAQLGGLAALTGPQECVAEMVTAYDRRRGELRAALNALPGVSCADPEGAFYLFADVSGSAHPTPQAFCEWLLRTCGVVVTPGTAFGPGGEHHVRLSFAAADTVIAETVHRLSVAASGLR
jgi:aspartate/methionine/tyrosine aminotransferase